MEIEIAIVYVQIIITECKNLLVKNFRKDHVENIFKIRLKISPQPAQSKIKRDRPPKNKGGLIVEDVVERPIMVSVRTSLLFHEILSINEPFFYN